jgi:coenzyme PQQ biosynthesis protein PqqD
MTSAADVTLEARFRREAGVIAQEAHGQTVLLRLQDGGYFALDEVGATIWELCDGQRTVADIVTEVCGEFDAPEQIVRDDVLEFVGSLQRETLLVADDG